MDQDALRDLLSVSWRMTSAKARKRGRRGIVRGADHFSRGLMNVPEIGLRSLA